MLQSKNMFDSIPLTDMSQLVEQSLAKIYLKMHRLDTALKYAQSSYNQMIKLNNKTVGGKATILNTLGLVYDKKGDLDSALNYFYQSLNYSSKDYSYGDIGSTNYQIAKVYQKLNIPDSVVYYANQSLEAAIKGNFYKNMIETSSFLADFYNTRDFKIAYKYSKIAITAKDDLFKLSEKYAYKSVTDFDEKERQYEIETEQIAYKNKIKQYALLSGLGVFFLIAFILYRSNQKEKKAKNLLQQQKDKVESTLTELRRTQNQLIQKEKLASLGELTAGIAHEIQNPLNFVNNFSELSVELIEELKVERSKVKEERDEELENDLLSDLGQNQEKINHHGKRASSIVKGMLEHSRMGTGERQLTDLNVLCDEYLRLAYHGLRAKDKDGSATRFNCDYELITDPNLPQISVVPQDIGRVLLNLLNNAFYAVQQKMLTGLENRDNQTLSALEDYQPKVTVTTQALENQIIIKIKDNGMGIPENILPKIFQPFFTTKPTGEGTGLGLSLAYDIVTKGHGGTMEVESTEGQGSKFTIRLPLKTN